MSIRSATDWVFVDNSVEALDGKPIAAEKSGKRPRDDSDGKAEELCNFCRANARTKGFCRSCSAECQGRWKELSRYQKSKWEGPPTTPKGQIGSSSPIGIHCAIHCHALWLPYPAMPPRFVEREGGAMPAMLACQTLPHCAIPCHALLRRHWQWPYGHACHTGAKTPIAPPQFVQLKGGATPEGQGIISDTSTLA